MIEHDISDRDPDDVHEYTLTITVEEYRIGDSPVYEAIPLRVTTDASRFHEVAIGEQEAADLASVLFKPNFRRWLEGEIKDD